jgi:hypothetical protein
LRYVPGEFTRIPNRYYTFHYGGIDFFALDSNTFNTPSPVPHTQAGDIYRRELQQRRHEIDKQEEQILAQCDKLNPDNPSDAEQLDEFSAKLDQINEVKIDIEKQLAAHDTLPTDWEQLNWLRTRLIESWQNSQVRGRIIFFHHPPYVTEATKWHQAQTLAVRHRLREVLNQVAKTLGNVVKDRPLVDIIFNGHAHCLEYLRTVDTGHADSHLNCIISGGGGHRPRRQRQEGNELMEVFPTPDGITLAKVADSLLYLGRHGHGVERRLSYSCVRVDVKAGNPPKFIIRPLIAERFGGEWFKGELEPFVI